MFTSMCRFRVGLTMFQVAIAVGAISVLTKRRESGSYPSRLGPLGLAS